MFLRMKWRALPKPALERYLRTLLIVENRAYPYRGRAGWKTADRRLRARLRWQRLRVVMHFKAIGGEVSPLVERRTLPHGAKWPGAARLVATRGIPLAKDVDA